MQYALSASDLCTFIRRTIRALRYHESGTALGLEISGKLARWVYQVQEPISLGRRHYSGLALWPMLVAVRRYLGANWNPVRVECDDDCLSWRNKFEERFGAPVVMGSAANAIVFESHLLKSAAILRTPLSDRVTFADLRRLASQRPPRTIPEAVRELVRIRMREPLTDMEGAAFLLGVSARTLQRQLGEAGVTYRDLVEQVRMERALHLIFESSDSVTDIALDLGYSDITSFTRAFRRWCGVAPSNFRRASPPGALAQGHATGFRITHSRLLEFEFPARGTQQV